MLKSIPIGLSLTKHLQNQGVKAAPRAAPKPAPILYFLVTYVRISSWGNGRVRNWEFSRARSFLHSIDQARGTIGSGDTLAIPVSSFANVYSWRPVLTPRASRHSLSAGGSNSLM